MNLEIISEEIRPDGSYKIQFAKDKDIQTYRYYYLKYWTPAEDEHPAEPGWEVISMSGLFEKLEEAKLNAAECIDWYKK